MTVLNWLGSPQTALTATLFNIEQLRNCFRHQDRTKGNDKSSLFADAHYILACFNQFDTPPLAEPDGRPSEVLNSLLYGLFRPLSDDTKVPDVDLTRQLLPELSFQLRMLRRRGVIPTMASLVAFLAAFVFSLIIAFIDLDYLNGASLLSFGLLVSWLPVLVVYMVVDRNFTSTERSAYVKRSPWFSPPVPPQNGKR